MSYLEFLRNIGPKKLAFVSTEVKKRHPSAREQNFVFNDSVTYSLLSRTIDAYTSKMSPKDYSGVLSAKEIKAVAVSFPKWKPELHSYSSLVVQLRLKPSLLPFVWRSWQSAYLNEHVKFLLSCFTNRHDWSLICGEPFLSLIQEWISQEEPAQSIQGWLREKGMGLTPLWETSDSPFNKNAPFSLEIKKEFLLYACSAQLLSEKTQDLIDWQTSLPTSQWRILASVNYLVSIPSHQWDLAMLMEIRRLYGMPEGGIPAFWSQVSIEIQKLFHTAIIGKLLVDAIGSKESERYKYWMAWNQELKDIKVGQANDSEYAILDFGGFIALEFFTVGNAAYFYTKDSWNFIVASGGLRRKETMKRRDLGESLSHSGAWEHRADDLVNFYLENHGYQPNIC